MTVPLRRRRLAGVVTAADAATTLHAAAAHEVASTPPGNLIGNPRFSKVITGKLKLNTAGWVLAGSPGLGTRPRC